MRWPTTPQADLWVITATPFVLVHIRNRKVIEEIPPTTIGLAPHHRRDPRDGIWSGSPTATSPVSRWSGGDGRLSPQTATAAISRPHRLPDVPSLAARLLA